MLCCKVNNFPNVNVTDLNEVRDFYLISTWQPGSSATLKL